jgi:hypothetical protein
MDSTDAAARGLEAALRDLTLRVTALHTALAAGRLDFASARASVLARPPRDHAALADAVHQSEHAVAAQRALLCAALGESVDTRLSKLLRRLGPSTARTLTEAAAGLRRALHALRVESAVGQRLLTVTQKAQDGLLGALGAKARGGAQRYDRHARSVHSGPSGELVRGTL